MTTIIRIEHPVPDFDRWRAAFESDPAGRARGGVRNYRIMRALDDPHHVMIDLEFDEVDRARAFLEGLYELWRNVDVMRNPTARIVELVDARTVET